MEEKRPADEFIPLTGEDAVKRTKFQEHTMDSRVLYLRNLSYECTPQEIAGLFAQWQPVKLLHLAHSGQAFVEFPSSEAAVAAEAHYSRVPVNIRNREPKISVSTQNATIDKGNNIIHLGPNGFVPPTAEVDNAGPPSRVVILNIFNSHQTAVTLESVHALASYIGPVNRIVLFEKDQRTNAMVEFRDLDTAVKAQKVLYRHHLWNNQTGLILTAFGKQTELTLPGGTNSQRGWDYTGANLAPALFSDPKVMAAAAAAAVSSGFDGSYGGQFQQFQPHQQMQQQQQQQQQQQPHQYQYYSAAPSAAASAIAPSGGAGGSVVMVSGLQKSEENVNLIYNLMSFWGNIKAIKFLGKKDNVAAVEYTSPEEAHNAYNLCKGASIAGAPISVTTSRFANVQISGNEAFAHDYSHDRTKRYTQGPMSAQYQAVMAPPSAKLHVAYLHGYSESAIRELFSAYGNVLSISFMPDNPTLGFVTMGSIADACTALVKLHGRPNQFDPNQRPLKVSFSRGNK